MGYLTKKGAMTQNQGNFSVFVSYSTKDIETIKPILQQMQSIQGLTIFFADRSLNPGDLISQRIIQSIKVADVFIVFYSESALQSSYVQQEIGVARGQEKIIIPILLDQTKPSGMIATNVHYLDIHEADKEDHEKQKLFQFLSQSIQYKTQKQFLNALLLLGIGFSIVAGSQSNIDDDY